MLTNLDAREEGLVLVVPPVTQVGAALAWLGLGLGLWLGFGLGLGSGLRSGSGLGVGLGLGLGRGGTRRAWADGAER